MYPRVSANNPDTRRRIQGVTHVGATAASLDVEGADETGAGVVKHDLSALGVSPIHMSGLAATEVVNEATAPLASALSRRHQVSADINSDVGGGRLTLVATLDTGISGVDIAFNTAFNIGRRGGGWQWRRGRRWSR